MGRYRRGSRDREESSKYELCVCVCVHIHVFIFQIVAGMEYGVVYTVFSLIFGSCKYLLTPHILFLLVLFIGKRVFNSKYFFVVCFHFSPQKN